MFLSSITTARSDYNLYYDHFRQSSRYYFPMKFEPLPVRLSWKEEAKRPWLKPKPKAKEVSTNLYKFLARAN